LFPENDNETNDEARARAQEIDWCGKRLEAWGWAPGGGLTRALLLSPAGLPRTIQAVQVVESALSRGLVASPAALFQRAWLQRWAPTPARAEIEAARAARAQAARQAAERQDSLAKRRQVVEESQRDGLAAEVAAALPPARRAEIEALAADRGAALAMRRLREWFFSGRVPSPAELRERRAAAFLSAKSAEYTEGARRHLLLTARAEAAAANPNFAGRSGPAEQPREDLRGAGSSSPHPGPRGPIIP
jgi:hypothetical protein